MQVWHNELKALGANYTTISGTDIMRFENAVRVIDEYLLKTG